MHHGVLRAILGLRGGKGASLGLAKVLHRGCPDWLGHAECGRGHGYRQDFRGPWDVRGDGAA